MASIAAVLKSHREIEKEFAAVNDLKNNHQVTDGTGKLTCYAKLAHQFPSRPLIDSGSQISIIKESVFKSLPARFRQLHHSSMRVQSASGDSLKVLGCSFIPIKIGNQHFTHQFIIIRDIRHPVIIGLDFLRTHNATLNFARNVMTIGEEDIELLGLANVISKGRLAQSISVKPQTTSFIYLKAKSNYVDPSICYQLSSASTPLLENEPGLFILNTFSHVHENNLLPALLINTTGKHFNLSRGNVLAHITPHDDSEFEVNEVTTTNTPNFDDLHADFDPKYSVHNLNIENPNITPEQRQRLANLIKSYSDIFATHSYDIGKVDIEVDIPLKPGAREKPIAQRPFRIPLALEKDVQNQVAQLLKYDIIEKSHSPWSFGLVTVKKRCGATRVCVDLRKLNQITENFSIPFTNFDTTLGRLSKSKYFSSIDINQAFLNLPVKPSDSGILSFVVDSQKYKYTRLPFGWSLSPVIFTEYMAEILQPLNEFTTNWMDDILVYSDDIESHFEHLKALFECIRQAKLKLKLPKCNFFRLSVKYVGYIISENGCSPDPEKISAIRKMTPPTTVTAVRAYLGTLNYYRRLIPDFAKIAKPLTELTHKNAKFQWTDERQKAFDTLKNYLISDHVLAFPDTSKPFLLFCDSSADCIGSCLIQKDENDVPRPVYFISHQLDKTQRKWSITDKEAYSIVYSLKKLRPIVYGCPVEIFTDHRPLLALQSGTLTNNKLERYALIISDYNAKITFLPGKRNILADWLSRYVTKDSSTSCNLINTDQLPPVERRNSLASDTENDLDNDNDIVKSPTLDKLSQTDIRSLQNNDVTINELIHLLETDPNNEKVKPYTIIDDLLHYLDDKGRTLLVLPKCLLPEVIKEAHQGYLGSHLGIHKTYDTLQHRYFCKGMWSAVNKYIQSCNTCASTNTRAQKIPVQEIPIPPHPFHTIAIDICGHFPQSSSNNRYVITVIDMLTSYIEAIPSPDKSAASVASFIVDEIIPRHSTPSIIISDNGSEFINEVIRYITDTLKITHIRSSTHNPESNGKLERSHRLLTDTLIKLSQKAPENWDKYVKNYTGAHNTCCNYTGYSPFYLLYHRLPTYPLDTLLRPRDIYYGEAFGPHLVQKMHRTFKMVRHQIKKESAQNRARFNQATSFDILSVGDIVYVKNLSRDSKLSTRWLPNPFIIVKKNGHHSFSVQNQTTNKITRLHQRNLRKVPPSDAWLRPTPVENPTANTRPRRRARNAVSSSSSSNDDSSSSSDTDTQTNQPTVDPTTSRSPVETPANAPLPQVRPDPVHWPSQTQETPVRAFPPDPIHFPTQSQDDILRAPTNLNPMYVPDPVFFPSPARPSTPQITPARPDPVHQPSQPRLTAKRTLSSSESDFMDHDGAKATENKKSRFFLLDAILNKLPKATLQDLPAQTIDRLISKIIDN